MATPVIAKGRSFTSKGISNPHGYMMIHAMAMNIWYQNRMWHYADLLMELDRGIHFAVLPCGQVIQHNDPRTMLWQARGANRESCAVELLVPGVFDLDALYLKINEAGAGYPWQQYEGLLNIQRLLVAADYVISPEYNWDLHHVQSHGRKKDPGSAFDVTKWTDMLRVQFNGE